MPIACGQCESVCLQLLPIIDLMKRFPNISIRGPDCPNQNGKVRIVADDSVSRKIGDAIPTMQFSRETEQYDAWVIPRVTLLKNLRITGAE